MIPSYITATNSVCPRIVTDEIQTFVYSMDVNQRNDWHRLEVMINQVQNDFSKRLRKEYPMLTEHDIHLILLIRTNMSNPRVARMMNIETDSFRMGRCRIKKKMGIETDSFSGFIRELYT